MLHLNSATGEGTNALNKRFPAADRQINEGFTRATPPTRQYVRVLRQRNVRPRQFYVCKLQRLNQASVKPGNVGG